MESVTDKGSEQNCCHIVSRVVGPEEETGRRGAPSAARLVRPAKADALDASVQAFQPALNFAADRELVLQMFVTVRADREDNQKCVGGRLVRVCGGRCCRSHFSVLRNRDVWFPRDSWGTTAAGRTEDARTGRGGEAAGLWRRRDSTLSRWRDGAGLPLVAFSSDVGALRLREGED